MESIFTAAGNWLGLVELLEACFMGREEHCGASGLHSGTNWSFGSHAAAFGLSLLSVLFLAEEMIGDDKFISPRDLSSVPVQSGLRR